MFKKSFSSGELINDCNDSSTALINKLELEHRSPIALEDVQADATKLVNVGVVDLGVEEDLGRTHRVVFGQQDLGFELPIFVGSVGRSADFDVEVPAVVRIGVDIDPLDLVLLEHSKLLVNLLVGFAVMARSLFIFWRWDLEVLDRVYVLKINRNHS